MSLARRNLGDLLGERRHSEELAILEVDAQGKERPWSFREIEQGSLALAGLLSAEGFAPGTAIGIMSGNSVRYLIAYFGIMRSGCVCVPVNIKQPAEVVEFICRDSEIEFVLHDEANANLVPQEVRRQSLETLAMEDAYGAMATELGQSTPIEESDTALIMYTSGSTGRPKGVVLSHASQLAMVDALTLGASVNTFVGNKGIVVAPMFHMNALVFIKAFLVGGGSILLMAKFDAVHFVHAVLKHQITVITGVPTMIALLHQAWEDLGRPEFPSVHTVFIGSSPVTERIVEQSREMMPAAKVLNSYGTTESGGALFGAHPEGIERPATSFGYPLPHVQARIEDGVLHVKAPSAMTCYLNLPEATTARVKDGWYNTGDLVHCDEQGFYYFDGRVDDMLVCSGENIYPGEVERVIEGHPRVSQAVVVPLSDEVRGQVPVAFVVALDEDLTQLEIQEHVRRHAAVYMYPRRVWCIDALPLSSTSKVDRLALCEEAVRRAEAEDGR